MSPWKYVSSMCQSEYIPIQTQGQNKGIWGRSKKCSEHVIFQIKHAFILDMLWNGYTNFSNE